MTDDKELERHTKIIAQIEGAMSKEEVPRITYSYIAAFLADNIKYNGKKLRQADYKPVIDALNDYGVVADFHVRDAFYDVMLKGFDIQSKEEVLDLYKQFVSLKRVAYVMEEINKSNDKLRKFLEKEELDKHNQFIDKTNKANEITDLPRVSISDLNKAMLKAINDNSFVKTFKISDISDIVDSYLNGRKDFDILVESLCNRQSIKDEDKKLMAEQIIGSIINDNNVKYIIEELANYRDKAYYLGIRDDFIKHKTVLENIAKATTIDELPKVSLSTLNQLILKCVNSNDFYNKFVTRDVGQLVSVYSIMNTNYFSAVNIKAIIKDVVDKAPVSDQVKQLMCEQIHAALMNERNIEYVVEELEAKENAKTHLYRNEHNQVMKKIDDAVYIDDLPNLSPSTLTGYFASNSTIYSNDNRIPSVEFKELSGLLLDGYSLSSNECRNEIHRLTNMYYPDKDDAYELLYDKFNDLPKTAYYVEEIKKAVEKKSELIKNSNTFVNIYFVPNFKNTSGGLFLDCYANQGEYLDLKNILPTTVFNFDLPGTRENPDEPAKNDPISDYVKKNYDPTFRRIGGIILRLGERFRNISIVIPDLDQKLVSGDVKAALDKVANLDTIDVNSSDKLLLVDQKVGEEKQFASINTDIGSILNGFENGLNDLLSGIQQLRGQLLKDDEPSTGGPTRK